ncbi:unnamed protein product, partial [marine sediment metagenome]
QAHPADLSLEQAKQLGPYCNLIVIGIQQTERLRRTVFQRSYSDDQVRELAYALDVPNINYDMITRVPEEMEADRQDYLELLFSLPRPAGNRIFPLTYFPGTTLTHRHLAQGKITPKQIVGKFSEMPEWGIHPYYNRLQYHEIFVLCY